MLPLKDEAQALLTTYFELASPTYRFLHRQTIESWLERMYNDLSTSDGVSLNQRAVILTVFAQATKYIQPSSSGTSAASGCVRYSLGTAFHRKTLIYCRMKYFQAAERHLARLNCLPDLTT